MKLKKDIVLIPYWIEETLRRNELPLSSILSLEKLKSVCAINDVASFMVAQDFANLVMGFQTSTGLFMGWLKNTSDKDIETRKYHSLILSMASAQSLNTEVKTRLFDFETKSNNYEQPFKVVDLDLGICGVVIYPGHFTEQINTGLQEQLLEAILKVLYAYNTYDEVAREPLFLRYLEVMS